LTAWPSVKATWMSWPVIWVLTVTWRAASRCRAPDHDRDVGLAGGGNANRSGCPWPKRARLACWGGLLWVVMYQPAATTIANPIPIPRRVLSRVIY
jgi:hypothetical protein